MTAEYSSSFAAISSRYDGFILDLWGVIHDGKNLYPDAKACLENLRAAGKKIVLLSNAPRRAAGVAEALYAMGIARTYYDALITSGEAAYQCMADPHSSPLKGRGDTYVYIGLEKDRHILDGLNYTETDNPSAAAFLLLSHSYYDNQPESELDPLLAECLAAKLPALCINPDRVVVRQTGEHVACAGAIAERYAERGGEVIYFGKPYPFVYTLAFAALPNIPASRILAVGDNLATDIKGAGNASLARALVTGGILKNTVGEPRSDEYAERCRKAIAEAGSEPDYVLPDFRWN